MESEFVGWIMDFRTNKKSCIIKRNLSNLYRYIK